MTSIAQAEDLKLSVSFSATLVANANIGDNRENRYSKTKWKEDESILRCATYCRVERNCRVEAP